MNKSNVFNYGATGDGIYDTAASITSGSAILTSINSIFAPNDVGKIMVVIGAGVTGRDLVTTIVDFTNPTQVILNTAAGTTVSNAGILFGTDQTLSIQNTINAIHDAGGGKVIIPNGIYIIAGALKTSVGGINMNCQLYIPNDNAQSLNRTHIVIEGKTLPNYTQYSPLQAANLNTYKGSCLVSTLTTGATGAAVIGMKGAASTYGSYSYNYLTVNNLAIKVLDNPGGSGPVIGGVSCKNGASLMTNNVAVSSIGAAQSSVLPANDVAGIETTDVSSETMNSLQNTIAEGFRTGFIVGEHTVLNQVQSFVCFRGMNLKNGYHAITCLRFGSYWCTTDIYVSGNSNIQNFNFDNEYMHSGFSGGKWYDNVATIDDPSSLLKGQFYYQLTKAYTGSDNAHLIVNGGKNLTLISPNYFNVKGTIPPLISITNPTATSFSSIDFKNNNGDLGQIFKTGTSYGGYKNLLANDFGIYNYPTGNISFLNDNPTGNINFATAGLSVLRMLINAAGRVLINTITDDTVNQLQVNGSVKATQFKLSALNTAPASSVAAGTTGEIRIVDGFIYVCVATNTWQRATLSTF